MTVQRRAFGSLDRRSRFPECIFQNYGTILYNRLAWPVPLRRPRTNSGATSQRDPSWGPIFAIRAEPEDWPFGSDVEGRRMRW